MRLLNIQAGGRNIAILGDEVASALGVHSSDRVNVSFGGKSVAAIVNISSKFPSTHVGLYEEVSAKLGTTNGEEIEVLPAELPESLHLVQAKIRRERLHESEIRLIVRDVVERHLSDVELAAFVTALQIYGMNMDEVEALSRAMVETGRSLELDRKPILDKHSIGGVPGDKTSILVVPIVAAAGFTIPKTSSRAVTSPAGTADRVESLCPVNLTIEEIKEVVRKTNACLVWGGALDLAPADDIFIQVEYPLAIDPMLLPSIMSKKKAMGVTHVVVDIPTGRGTKTETLDNATELAYDFVDLGRRLDISVQCGITFGEQPLGLAIGPALEAREALSTLMGNGPSDLVEKALSLAGILLEMVGVDDGKQRAEAILRSGKAEGKIREIVEAQGGNPSVKPEDIKVGDKTASVMAEADGRILWINNEAVARVARAAGAPKDKGAGVLFKAKLGDHVEKDGVLFEVFAERDAKLESALELSAKLKPVSLSVKPGDRMLLGRVPAGVVRPWDFVFGR